MVGETELTKYITFIFCTDMACSLFNSKLVNPGSNLIYVGESGHKQECSAVDSA